MNVAAFRRQGYDLLHNGAIELSVVESNGIRIDMPKLQRTKEELAIKIRDLKEDLLDTDVWSMWRRRFGDKAKLGSRDQFAEIFYGQLGFKPVKQTDSGGDSADEEALIQIDHPFVEPYLKISGYEKTLNTFIHGIESETVDGRLHPVFNLHTVLTYRSSSDSPNFHNFPIRDKELAKIVRSLFIASKGNVLPENDFKGVEVGISACYHKDANFISYITTPGKDMHRDIAAQLFKLETSEVSKEARQISKNSFVFPQFYGDFWGACAKYIWKAIDTNKVLVGKKGYEKLLRDHLTEVGFTELGEYNEQMEPDEGSFMAHVKSVQDDFWNNRFRGYGQWRKDFYNAYLQKGYFDIFTGFRISGVVRKNAVTNYPIQGTAFHCLLWTLIQMNRKLRKYKMRGMIVGQIHDNLVGDTPPGELRDYWEMLEETISVELPEYYEWLNVPLEIEYEIPPYGTTWFDKRQVQFSRGVFQAPEGKPTTDVDLFLDDLDVIDRPKPEIMQRRAPGHKH